MNKLSVRLRCPNCRLDGDAVIKESFKDCLVFVCPKCESTVVYYDNKTEIISQKLLHKLVRQGKLKFCGKAKFVSKKPKKRLKQEQERSPVNESKVITDDDILNLKIILETEKDSSRIINLL